MTMTAITNQIGIIGKEVSHPLICAKNRRVAAIFAKRSKMKDRAKRR